LLVAASHQHHDPAKPDANDAVDRTFPNAQVLRAHVLRAVKRLESQSKCRLEFLLR